MNDYTYIFCICYLISFTLAILILFFPLLIGLTIIIYGFLISGFVLFIIGSIFEIEKMNNEKNK